MNFSRFFIRVAIPVVALMAGSMVRAAQLSTGARAAILYDTQQFVVINYRAMQNSSVAMKLRDRVMPPELQ